MTAYKRVMGIIIAVIMAFSPGFTAGVYAAVDPAEPGSSQSTAWNFSNVIDVETKFSSFSDHYYKLVIDIATDNYELIYTPSASVPRTIRIYDDNNQIAWGPTVTTSAVNVELTLENGTYYVRVSDSPDPSTYQL